tara:strand:- start:82 stop:516 length:435 start_codon:yes stop_codon:yes gene_type:complete
MSDRIKNMVDAINAGKGSEFKGEFQNAVNELISSKLQTRKAEMANEFANGSASEEQETIDEYIEKDGTRRKCKGGDGRRTDKDGNKINVKEEEVDEGSAEEYEKFFRAALKKFKVDSPADFKSDEEKKKFFDYVDKEYKGEKSD